MRGLNRLTFAAAALLLCAWSPGCGGSSASTTPSSIPPPAAQSWADEFDGPANTLPDPAKWTYDLGNNNGWGNRELENYTNLVQNVHVDGSGHLIIHVDQSGSTYTSARIKTQGLFSARYGRVEARIRLPFGQGIWPAFWMLGTNITSVGWPQCGEVDVMENIGREPSVNHGSLHGPGYSGGNSVTGLFTLPGGVRFSDDFHVFAVAVGGAECRVLRGRQYIQDRHARNASARSAVGLRQSVLSDPERRRRRQFPREPRREHAVSAGDDRRLRAGIWRVAEETESTEQDQHGGTGARRVVSHSLRVWLIGVGRND